MVLGPVTKEFFDQVITQIKKPDNQEKLKNGLVDPLISYLHSRLFPYLQFLGILMAIIILLLLLVVYLNIRR